MKGSSLLLQTGLTLILLIVEVLTTDDDEMTVNPLILFSLPRSPHCPCGKFFRGRCYTKNCLRRWHDPESDCWCSYGYYNKWVQTGSVCSKCDPKCKSCKGNPNQCTVCSNPNLSPPYCCSTSKDHFTGCHRSRSVMYRCITCHRSCASCTQPDNKNACTTCKPGSILVKSTGTCLPIPGYYQDPNTGDNLPCFNTCQTCRGPLENDCLTCKNEFRLSTITGSPTRCVCDTDAGNFLTPFGGCQRCDPKCSRCSGSPSNCSQYAMNAACFQEQTCKGFTWVCKCKIGFFEDSNLGCSACHNTCKSCTNQSPNSCLSCKPNTILLEIQKNQRICVCKDGYTLNTATGECYLKYTSDCHKTCLTCSGPTANDCTSCNTTNSRYIASNSSCQCTYGLISTASNTNAQCAPYQYCDTKYIVERTFDDKNKLIDQKCKCPQGYGRDPTTSLNQFVCKVCSCYWGCDPNNYKTCTCDNTEFLWTFGSNGYWNPIARDCSLCHITCKTCKGPLSTDCLTCQTQTNLDPDRPEGTCQTLPPIIDLQTCHITCQTCSKSSDASACLTCKSGLLLSNGYCGCPQTNQYLDIQTANCITCGKNCDLCDSTGCLLCKSGTVLNPDSVACACPPGTGMSLETTLTGSPTSPCVSCNPGCEQCNPENKDICLLCTVGYFLTNTSLCQACHPTCGDCTSAAETACSVCGLEYYFVETTLTDGSTAKLCEQNYTCPDGCQDNCELVGETIRCVSCSPGYFVSMGSPECLRCPNKRCDTCTISATGSRCNSCLDSSMVLVDGDCLCSAGKVFSDERMTCIDCDSSCLQCDGLPDNCTVCRSGMILFAASEDAILPKTSSCRCSTSNSFFDSTTLTCIPCQSTCSSCSNSTACLTCGSSSDGTKLILSQDMGNQICICPAGYYTAADLTCKICHPMCKMCSGPGEDQCTECAFVQLTQLDNSISLNCTCSPRALFDPLLGQCVQCDTLSTRNVECSQFAPNLCDCINCTKESSFLSPDGFCTECPPLCLSCSSQQTCTTCTNYSLLQPDLYNYTTCVCPPGVGFNETTRQCTICPAGKYQSWGENQMTFECRNCQDNCEICEAFDKCLKYKNGTETPAASPETPNTNPDPSNPSSAPTSSPSVPTNPTTNLTVGGTAGTETGDGALGRSAGLVLRVETYLDELVLSVAALGGYATAVDALTALHQGGAIRFKRVSDGMLLPANSRSIWNPRLARLNKLRAIMDISNSIEHTSASLLVDIKQTNARLLQVEQVDSPRSEEFIFKSYYASDSPLFQVWDFAAPVLSLLSILLVFFVAIFWGFSERFSQNKQSAYLLHTSIWIQLTLLSGLLSIYFNGILDKILQSATHALLTVYSLGLFKTQENGHPDDAYLGKFTALSFRPSLTRLLMLPLSFYLLLWAVSGARAVICRNNPDFRWTKARQAISVGFAPMFWFASGISVMNAASGAVMSGMTIADLALSIFLLFLLMFDWSLMLFSCEIHATDHKVFTKFRVLTPADGYSLLSIDSLSEELNTQLQPPHKWSKRYAKSLISNVEVIGTSSAAFFLACQGNIGNTGGFLFSALILGICVALYIQENHKYRIWKLLQVGGLGILCLLGSIMGIFESKTSIEAARIKSIITIVILDESTAINLVIFVKRVLFALKDFACLAKTPKGSSVTKVAPINRTFSSEKILPGSQSASDLRLPGSPLANPQNPLRNIDPETPQKPDESGLLLNSNPSRLLSQPNPILPAVVPIPGLTEAEHSKQSRAPGKVLLPWKKPQKTEVIPLVSPKPTTPPREALDSDTLQATRVAPQN